MYQAKGVPIHNQYEENIQAVERLVKARERNLKKRIQAEYDTVTPVQDILAQLAGDMASIDSMSPTPGSVQYAFAERSRIAMPSFNPLLGPSASDNVDWRTSIVDDMVSLCTRQEGRFRKALCDVDSKLVESESYKSESRVNHLFPLQCKIYQCLCCLGDATSAVNILCTGILPAITLSSQASPVLSQSWICCNSA